MKSEYIQLNIMGGADLVSRKTGLIIEHDYDKKREGSQEADEVIRGCSSEIRQEGESDIQRGESSKS